MTWRERESERAVWGEGCDDAPRSTPAGSTLSWQAKSSSTRAPGKKLPAMWSASATLSLGRM